MVDKQENVDLAGVVAVVKWIYTNRGKILSIVAVLAGIFGYNLDGMLPTTPTEPNTPVEQPSDVSTQISVLRGDVDYLYTELGVPNQPSKK